MQDNEKGGNRPPDDAVLIEACSALVEGFRAHRLLADSNLSDDSAEAASGAAQLHRDYVLLQCQAYQVADMRFRTEAGARAMGIAVSFALEGAEPSAEVTLARKFAQVVARRGL